MQINNCTKADLPLLMNFYEMAREYQRTHSNRNWHPFEPENVLEEILDNRQWKLTEDGEVTAVFLTTYSDPVIWGARNEEPSVYLHRIVTHPAHHGKNNMQKIIAWAKEHGKSLGKQFIRMDTWGDNPRLVDYYIRCGFTLLEVVVPEDRSGFPAYYNFDSMSLLQMDIG